MKYFFSAKAEGDLVNIYDFSFNNFGKSKADQYFNKLIDGIEKIAQFPSMGVAKKELGERVRGFLSG